MKEESSASAAESQDDKPRPQSMLTYEESNGKILYLKYCAVCHGVGGAGDGFNAYNLRPAEPRNFTDKQTMSGLTDDQILNAISKGGASRGLSPLMPAWGNTFNERQIRYLAKYIRALASSKSGGQTP